MAISKNKLAKTLSWVAVLAVLCTLAGIYLALSWLLMLVYAGGILSVIISSIYLNIQARAQPAKASEAAQTSGNNAFDKNHDTDSKAFFYYLIQNNVDGIALIDEKARIFYQSPAAEKISGFTPEEVKGHDGFEFMHPDDRQTVAMFFGEVMAQPGCTRQIQYRTRHKDGHYMWIEANVLNLMHSNEIKCVLVNYRDITGHILAEEKIRQQERRFRSLVEHDFDAIVILDAETRPVYRSPAAEKITGLTIDDRTVQQDFTLIHPDDRQMVRDKWQQSLAQPETPITVTSRIITDKGETRWTESIFTNFLSDPAISGIVINYRDITTQVAQQEKLRQSELLYRAVVENSIDLVILFDADGFIKYRSPSVAKLTGISNEERMENQSLDIFHPDDLADILESWDKIKATEGVPLTRVIRIRHRDGHFLSIECSVTNHLKTPGIAAVIFNGRDITDRKAAEEQVRALNELLEKKVALRTSQLEIVNKELEAFSYSVSHDLKAPLRIIEGYAKILSRPRNNLSPDLQRDLLVISDNAIRMERLINALLNFSRLGRAPLNKKMVNMDDLVSGAIAEVTTAEPNFSANIQTAPLQPALCDPTLVYRVWINLLHNALKYSRNRQPPQIQIGMTEVNGEQVYFVKDNGVGFDMKNADRLFTVFQRLHSESDFEGTGVGLALVNSIIKKHEGRIWAEAAENQGANFYFTLGA
jgi:PAS domain S-box-containing protein